MPLQQPAFQFEIGRKTSTSGSDRVYLKSSQRAPQEILNIHLIKWFIHAVLSNRSVCYFECAVRHCVVG